MFVIPNLDGYLTSCRKAFRLRRRESSWRRVKYASRLILPRCPGGKPMAIEITCLGCGKILRLPDAVAGTKGKCNHCGAIIRVPTPEEQPIIEATLEFQPTATAKSQPQQPPASEGKKWHILTPDGQKYGPVDESEVITWIQQGRIGVDTSVWREGMGDWALIESTPLFSQYCSRVPASGAESHGTMQPRMGAGVRCPKCGAMQISADKKGYGGGKGCLGWLLAGPIGLLCGFCGSRKILITCLSCGYQWHAGKR